MSFLFILLIAGFVISFVISVWFWLLKPVGNIYITATKYGVNLCFMALIVWQISSTKLGYAMVSKALKPLGVELAQTTAKSEKVTDKITNTKKNTIADNAKPKTKEKTKFQTKTVNKQNNQNKQVTKKLNKSAEKQAEEQSAKEAEEQLRRFNEQLKAQKQRKQRK